MKTIAYIIVIFFLFPFKGLCQSSSLQPDSISALFQLFLNDFAVNDRKEIDIITFGGDVFQQMIDKDRYGMFLPEPNDCDCSLINWQQGSFLQKGDVVVVFMERFCHDDEFYNYCDYMVVTYTKDGHLIDNKSVGRTGRLYNFRMEGKTESLRIVSECGELMNRDELRDYGDLMYLTEKKKYSVCKDGRIKESKIGKERVEAVPQKDGIVKPVTFDEYLNLFIPLESDKVSEETFFRYDYKEPGYSYQKELEYSYRKAFLPDSTDCDCMPRNSIWSPKYRLESEKYITVFFENFCDYPKGPSPFFTDRVIATYSKDGHLIDIRDIARYGDYWEPQIDDSSTLSSITVRQGFIDEKTLNQPVKSVKVVVSRHGVMPDGTIHSETVKTYQTTGRWDEKKNQIVF